MFLLTLWVPGLRQDYNWYFQIFTPWEGKSNQASPDSTFFYKSSFVFKLILATLYSKENKFEIKAHTGEHTKGESRLLLTPSSQPKSSSLLKTRLQENEVLVSLTATAPVLDHAR